jgi:hypothetical protein
VQRFASRIVKRSKAESRLSHAFWPLCSRRKKEVLLARKGAQEALRNELKGPITALLISCEMALQVPDLQSAAEAKLRTVYDLVQQVRTKLEIPA